MLKQLPNHVFGDTFNPVEFCNKWYLMISVLMIKNLVGLYLLIDNTYIYMNEKTKYAEDVLIHVW